MDPDLQQRFDALSVPELRRRVELALGYVREVRRALAVHVGMTAEEAPGPIPPLDVENGKRMLEEVAAMLPLLGRRLTPEERANLRERSPGEMERLKETLADLEEDPEGFDSAMEEAELAYRHEDLAKIREGMQKTDMLFEVAREVEAFASELAAYKEHIEGRAEALLERLARASTS